MKQIMPLLAIAAVLAGCRNRQPRAPAQDVHAPAVVSVSNWTDKTELFMEHQPLAAGAKRRFSVHFTDLATFKPLSGGTVTILLRGAAAAPESFSTAAPSRPGIFGVDVQPRRAGRYSLSVSVNAPSLRDTHELGEVIVYPSEAEIPAAPEEPAGDHIAFLKEQQWTLDFGTELARSRNMRESLVVPGEVRPRSGGEMHVTAPIAGRISPVAPLPVLGAAVADGQQLTSILPLAPAPADKPSLDLAVSEARTALDLVRRELARAENLLAVGAIPARRVEELRAAEATASARVLSAERRLEQFETSRQANGPAADSGFSVRAPLGGVIAEVAVSPGSNVNPGERLFRVVAVDRVYVAANVPESEIYRVARLNGCEIEARGLAARIPSSRLVARSSVIDARTRTLSILFEVANPARALSIGQAVGVRLFLGGSIQVVTVPETAIVDDSGRPVVFVQTEGEAFVRRPVTLGIREGSLVQIADGLRAGERVVTRGAYLIRLAALSTQIPAHGHVH